MAFYSLVSICTSFGRGLASFAGFRFLLGAGNLPTGLQPPRRSQSGSQKPNGVWRLLCLTAALLAEARPAFMIRGALGFVWMIGWRWLYYPLELHPHICPGELQMIATDRSEAGPLSPAQASPRWRDLLKLPQTWGTIIAKTFTDPVWFFVTDWFPIYLVAKGIDLYHRDSVASVSGLSGTGAGIGTIVAFKLIGYFSDARQAARNSRLRPQHDRRGSGPVCRHDFSATAGPQHQGDRPRPGA